MILTTVEALRIVKGLCDLERQLPKDQQSPDIAREARLTADVLIERSQQERAALATMLRRA